MIERNTQRRVVGFMPSSQQHPDLLSFVFVNSPLLKAVPADVVPDETSAAALKWKIDL